MNTGNYLFWLNSPLRFYALGLQCRNNLVFVLFQYWQCTFVFRIVRVNIVQKSSRKSVCEPRTPERKTTILTSFQKHPFFFHTETFLRWNQFLQTFFYVAVSQKRELMWNSHVFVIECECRQIEGTFPFAFSASSFYWKWAFWFTWI